MISTWQSPGDLLTMAQPGLRTCHAVGQKLQHKRLLLSCSCNPRLGHLKIDPAIISPRPVANEPQLNLFVNKPLSAKTCRQRFRIPQAQGTGTWYEVNSRKAAGDHPEILGIIKPKQKSINKSQGMAFVGGHSALRARKQGCKFRLQL